MTETASIDASYENAEATCPSCGGRNVYNRVTDIGSVQAIDHHKVVCERPGCGHSFAINGDLINPAHETLLLDARGFLTEKRYCQAVLSATTAYEVIFSHFFRVELVERPAKRDRTTPRDQLEWINQVTEVLQNKLETLTFQPLRNLFLRFAVDGFRVDTIGAARSRVDDIKRNPKPVLRGEIEAVVDEELRDILLQVHNSTIAELRNKIVHKSAYRPHRNEAKAAVDEAWNTILRLGRYYRLKHDELHWNEHPDM